MYELLQIDLLLCLIPYRTEIIFILKSACFHLQGGADARLLTADNPA
jgi:hypothetical protein